jgi:deoxyguanosine kinase
MKHSIYLGLGSNVGDRVEFIAAAIRGITDFESTVVDAVSNVYQTEPVGDVEQNDFLNLAVSVQTDLSYQQFHQKMKWLEKEIGRTDSEHWGPREIDIDLLLFDSLVINTDDLRIPHGEIIQRKFVLKPLSEIAPNKVHPIEHKTIEELYNETTDSYGVLYSELHMIQLQTRPSDIRYIAIEGVIGAGKTSLAKMITERLQAKLVLEKFEENPFLTKFYEDQEHYAFQTQIFFLLSRYKQQQELFQGDLFYNFLVSDYIFDKDKIFAYLTLQDDELKLYETLISTIEKNIPTPDLVVYLQSSTERLMGNIKQRGRSFEENMSEEYIKDLNEAYNYFFFRYKNAPLLIINSTEIDFVNEPHDFEDLLEQILKIDKAPVEYYNPKTRGKG